MTINFTHKIFHLLTLLFLSLAFISGCAEEESKEDEVCGGHGEMHGTHCHCDSGYIVTSDGTSCEPGSELDNIDYGGDFIFEPTEIQASTSASNGSQTWLLEAIADDVHLRIEIYESYGGISSPGSMSILDVDANYKTCGTCLLLQTGCVLHGDHYDCQRTFMPKTGGEVHVDEIGTNVGDAFSGELLGVIFQEVNIAQDFETEPVEDGTEHHLAPWSFATELQ